MPNEDALKDQGTVEKPNPTPNQDQEQEQVQEQDGGEDEFNKDRALETIRKQRESEKALAKQLKEAKAALEIFQADEKKRKDAELSELDKSKNRVAELETQLKEAQTMTQALRLRQEFAKAAARLKVAFADTQAEDDAFELSDMEEVEIGADGKITGLDDAIKALQKTRPYLFKQAESDGKGTPPRGPKSPSNGQQGKQDAKLPVIRF